MVHLRINEREPIPNPYVNFTTVLPVGNPTIEEAASQLLRALAAQVKPVMKAHGLVVNSLEEYKYNNVFAGRNWNHGETIELVLRSSTGSLLSTQWLMSTLCHELAHIKHMNHGSAFQALWHQLQQEVLALQSRGYYGDGYWSSGTRLIDSAKVAGQGIKMGELPEYMCGGAHSRARPVSRLHKFKGLQTPKRRKAGMRVNSSMFDSTGRALNEDLEGEDKSHGIGFRKKAGSKRAREERALAAEQRIQVLQGKVSSSIFPVPPVAGDDLDSQNEQQDSETDYDRRRTLLEVVEEKDLGALRTTTFDPAEDFLLPNDSSSGKYADACGVEDPQKFTATGTFDAVSGPASGGFGRTKTFPSDEATVRPRKKRKTSQSKLAFTYHATPTITEATEAEQEIPWNCMVCTLTNVLSHSTCSACGTPRGESEWIGENRPPL